MMLNSQLNIGFGYTGQCNYAYINLLDYGARWYSSSLGRFTQPDSIVPDMTFTQDWNRFAYVRNNPINYTDPSGHIAEGAYGYDNEKRIKYPTLTDWEKSYGLDIASEAIKPYEEKDDYYAWGYADDENMYAPPPAVPDEDMAWETDAGKIESLSNRLKGRIPVICADIPILAYHNNGVDLYGGNWDDLYSDFGTYMSDRSVQHLRDEAVVTKTWDDGVGFGDTVVSSTHAAVIVDFSGKKNDPSKIWVVETSGQDRGVTVITLEEFSTRTGESYINFSYLQFLP